MIGVVSDTHGLLRPEAVEALRGCDVVVHAGDVGDPDVLEGLGAIAPVRAVRGNVDRRPPLSGLPETEWVEAEGLTVYAVHVLEELDLDPEAAGVDVVVYGHTHRPRIERRGPVLYLNPGSAGPRRFDLPVTVALVTVARGAPVARIVPLLEPGSSPGT